MGALTRTTTCATALLLAGAVSAAAARAWGVGVNWYLNQNVKFVVNYDRTTFDGGNADGADRQRETAIFSRMQFAL